MRTRAPCDHKHSHTHTKLSGGIDSLLVAQFQFLFFKQYNQRPCVCVSFHAPTGGCMSVREKTVEKPRPQACGDTCSTAMWEVVELHPSSKGSGEDVALPLLSHLQFQRRRATEYNSVYESIFQYMTFHISLAPLFFLMKWKWS